MVTAVTPYRPPDYLVKRPTLPNSGWLFDWYLTAKRAWWDDWEQPEGERTWRASSLGYCLRRQTLERRGIDALSHPDAKTYRTFAYGDMVHDFVRKAFWNLGLVVCEEPTFVDLRRDVTGHVDLIWTPTGVKRDAPDHWSDEYQRYIAWLRQEFAQTLDTMYGGTRPDIVLGMEIKSAHSKAMTRLVDEGPYPWHRIQAGAYKAMAQTTPGALPVVDGIDMVVLPSAVERWHIVYVGKDSVGILQFEVEDAWVDAALSRLDELNRHWKGGLLPPCTCSGWWVQSCPYSEGGTCCGRWQKGQVAAAFRRKGN
jgi:hypothetical protein